MNPVGTALTRVATFGLGHVEDRPDVPWSRVDAEALWGRAVSQRLTGLLAAELTDAEGHHLVPRRLIDTVEPRLVARAVTLMALEQRLAGLVGSLEAAGVGVAAVKGPVLGRSLYPEHWWRDFGDLDLLVPADAFETALAVLESHHTHVAVAPLSRRAATLLGKGLTLRHQLGFEVDLHHTLLSGALGFGLGWDWWMGDAVTVDIGGCPVRTTGTTRTALHLLAHLSVGGPVASLHVARDVAECLNSVDPSGPAAEELSGAVVAAGLDGLLQDGVDRVADLLPWRNEAWMDWRRCHPTPDHWREVEDRFARQQSFGAVVRASLRAHRRPSDRLAVLRAVAWPSADHLRGRRLTRPGYLLQLGRSVSHADR